ncbi:ParB/RepB/Spo0J family partition protein [Neolewinella antarctica]|uniref:ParB family chromosome partitioning protein n=1 Tax=Neolewinella antarctica TaxID=442734 RepID=A0ABX0X668_9BACT|nr:ParB/RepB/Spo0J family partition protein [Neolewinella antarctica]NJC24687.1 ParB family chromosome partitioning protein [Neolewinella antarctica]
MAKKFNPGKKPSKSTLNKGIDALLKNRTLDEAMEERPQETVRTLSRDFSFLPLTKIHANPDQPRKEFDDEPLAELANSIKVHGIIQPMTVRHMGDGTYQIISGERRFRASQLAGLTEVPAFIRTANDQTLLEMALIENIQRQDLNPMEVAYSYYRLAEDFSLTQQEVAFRVGKQRPTVTNYLAVLNTSPKVQQAVREKKISIGAAKTFASIKDIGQQELFLGEILKNANWSVRKIEEEARGYKSKNKVTAARQPENEDITTVREAFQKFFGTKQVKVTLDNKADKSGSISLKFANREQLEQFYKAVE